MKNNMNPEEPDYKPKTIYSDPQGLPPASSTTPVFGTTQVGVDAAAVAASSKSSKKSLIIAAAIGGSVLIIVIIIVAVLSMSSSNTKKKELATDLQPAILQPANGIELEQINGSINQDISSNDDQKDYPPDSLDDKTLGL